MEKSDSFSILVEYCNSWGFYSKFLVVSKAVQNKYPSAKVEGKGIGGRTGCFEVIVTKSNGKTKKIHSKLAGEGFVESEKTGVLMKKLESFLEEK